jgi:hypothetical protein
VPRYNAVSFSGAELLPKESSNMTRPLTVLALAGALLAVACDDQPTSPRPGQKPSAVIVDANHEGDNKEVFFLPPMVPNPAGSEFFDVGHFNPNLTSAVIRVCHMVNNTCEPVATFGALAGATGPIVISAEQEHYLATWHTDESALVVGGAYQIQVFADADLSGVPVARADLAVVGTGKELKNANTNETIGLVDGRTLPIKVRFETGARCASENCLGQRVTDAGGTLVLESGNGALLLQDGWLPPGISEVTVTLQRHPPGPNNECVGNAAFTGPGLVAQREACLEVTTDPVLVPGPTTGIQRPAFIFVCTESDEEDPLHEFLQIIKADDGRPLQALDDVSHEELLALGFDPSCEGTPSDISFGSHPLLRLASRGLHAITRPVARLLEVKPLYAIDLGQGGEIDLFDGFSYFTLGVQASAATFGTVPASAPVGSLVPLSIQVSGQTRHPPNPVESDGLAGIAVTFTVTGGGGLLSDPAAVEPPLVSSLSVSTNVDGVATVNLNVGTGTNIVQAVAMVGGSPVTLPVTFTVAAFASVVQTLIACSPEDRGGDLISRGWYVPSFPGVSLTSVQLELLSRPVTEASVAGVYTFDLTARSSTYDGPVVARSRVSVTLDGASTPVSTTFPFRNPAIAEGSLVTFAVTMVSGPADAQVLYGVVGSFEGDPSCPIIETNGTEPPLSTFRRQGIVATIAGGARPPVIE